jgi:hypothetical protein
MALDQTAISVLNRPLPKDKIQKRPGKAGMEFSYITPDFVIDTLNEAFSSDWSTRIVSSTMYENVAVVGLELEVPTAEGKTVRKQQFGSCEVTRGLGTGEAFKGAASDALKKCATLLGLGLELYKDDEVPAAPTPPQFRAPSRPSAPPAPVRPSSPVAPARPVPAPRAATPAPAKPAPVAPKATPNPFGGGNTAAVPKPAAPRAPAAPRENPFTSNAEASGPNSTQMNAMVNLADRKGVTPAALISLAGIVDDLGSPVQSFEDLNRDQAIQVIKAAQQL